MCRISVREPPKNCLFFNDTATTEIYPLSLHDALPISTTTGRALASGPRRKTPKSTAAWSTTTADRKSTRLNSSHGDISYAAFCLKKKKQADNIYAAPRQRLENASARAPQGVG